MLAGPSVAAQDLGEVSVCDIAPTLLWAMGVGIPNGMEGRVIAQAFHETFADSRQIVKPEERQDVPDWHNGADEVAQRLKALGYI